MQLCFGYILYMIYAPINCVHPERRYQAMGGDFYIKKKKLSTSTPKGQVPVLTKTFFFQISNIHTTGQS
jgi:hypothetical protein